MQRAYAHGIPVLISNLLCFQKRKSAPRVDSPSQWRASSIISATQNSVRVPDCESSRKVPVLGQFTIHMVEIIQLYTDQPHTWLGFRHHPSSSVFQPYIWLGYSLNDEIRRNEPHFLGHFKELHQNSVNSEMDHVHG